eukprot:Rhum_TRINITY_DN13925_c2_g1::Rhum_TRINITY_DN13925_c2_g1_i2::g.65587::m.65587
MFRRCAPRQNCSPPRLSMASCRARVVTCSSRFAEEEEYWTDSDEEEEEEEEEEEACVVFDHIARGATRAECWRTVEAVREVMEWRRRTGSQGVYESKGLAKGVISLPAMAAADLDAEGLKKLAALAPGCTVNVVEGRRVVAKYRLRTPSRIFNIPSVQCKNEKCVSHEEQKQPDVCSDLLRVPFYVTSALKCQLPAYEVALKGELAALDIAGGAAAAAASTSDAASAATAAEPEGSGHHLYVCRYCMWPHFYKDIWKAAA